MILISALNDVNVIRSKLKSVSFTSGLPLKCSCECECESESNFFLLDIREFFSFKSHFLL